MLNRRLILSLLLTGMLLLPTVTFADTFSLYGHVHEADGTPIKGAFVKLSEFNGLELRTTVTDSNGNYSFNDIICNTSLCSVRIVYPGNSYDSPDNYHTSLPATGVQTANAIRIKLQQYSKPDSPLNANFNLVLLFFIGITVLGCIYLLIKIAKNWRY